MKASDIPVKFQVPFASSAGGAYIATPVAYAPGAPNVASLQDGFPPETWAPGGAPRGQDFNGLFYQVTGWNQWQQAGANVLYDATFQTEIGGYPKGAVVGSVTAPGCVWVSLADDNTTNPDTNGANWDVFTRIRLTGASAVYVNASTGSDTTGTGTLASPWQTIQHAYDRLLDCYDLAGQIMTIVVAGSFTAGLLAQGNIIGQNGPASLFLDGGGTATIAVSAAGASCVQADSGAQITLQNITVSNSDATAFAVRASRTGVLIIGLGVTFAASTGIHAQAVEGGLLYVIDSYTISGGASIHWEAVSGGAVLVSPDGNSITVTLTGTPAFSTAFAHAFMCGVLDTPEAAGNLTFSGSATGVRYLAELNGVINTQGGGATFYPGGSAGSTATGGQYA